MAQLEVRPVETERDNQAFLRLPWTIYADDPRWTPPLWREHMHYFDPAHNPELRHMTMQKFVAWRGDTPVGTIIAHVNHAYNEFHGVNDGWFGQFELLNDPEAGAALLKEAEDWLRFHGVAHIIGPATFSTNSEVGLLVEGHDTRHMPFMPHHRDYYQGFIEGREGYAQEVDIWAWYIDGEDWGGRAADKIPAKIERVVGKLRQRRTYEVRDLKRSRLQEEITVATEIYNSAWEKNWGFVPMGPEEIEALAEQMVPILDPKITVLASVDGKTVAFGIPIPDIYKPLRLANCKPGEPHWWQLLKLVWHWRIRGQIDGVRAWGLGVLEEYRGTGIDAILYYEMMKRGLPRGYKHIEMSWILADNDMMNRPAEMMGAEVYRVYRVYRKAL